MNLKILSPFSKSLWAVYLLYIMKEIYISYICLFIVFGEQFHSSDKGVYIFCVNTVHFFFLKSAMSPRQSFTSLKNAVNLETWTFKNADGWAFFESCTTKSAGGLESQMYSCIFNGQRTEFWSLGTSFPENTIVGWWGKQGYHFLNLHCRANAEIKWHTLGVV